MLWLTELLAILELLVKVEPLVEDAIKGVFDIITLWKTKGQAPTQDQLDALRSRAHTARQAFDAATAK